MNYTLSQLVEGVEETGDFLVFRVESSDPKAPPYTVDLACWSAFGRCDCPDFRTRKNTKIREGARPLPYLECKHIRKARRFYAIKKAKEEIEQKLKAANENKRKNHHPACKPDHEAVEY